MNDKLPQYFFTATAGTGKPSRKRRPSVISETLELWAVGSGMAGLIAVSDSDLYL